MRCPSCGSKTKTTNSRPFAGLPVTRRRRECSACRTRFNSFEVSEATFKQIAVNTGALSDLVISIRKRRKT